MKLSPRTFCWIIATVLVVVTTAPFVYGYFSRPEGSVFSGIHHMGAGDTNTYLAFIEQARQGNILFTNLFTSEDQPRLLFQPHWLMLGWIAKLTSSSSLFVFHFGRILLDIVLVFVAYRIIAYFFEEERKRRITLLIVLFSSGIGLFFNPFMFNVQNIEQHPTDMWVSESITFLSTLQSPHFVLSLILLLLTLFFGLRAILESRIRLAVYAGCIALFLFLVHPFYVATVYAVIGCWVAVAMLAAKKWLRIPAFSWLTIAIISAPTLGYLFWMNSKSFVLHEWAAQNILRSPLPIMYVLGFGFLLPLAVYGAITTFHDPRFRMLTVWCITGIALVYAPVDFQRRLIEGFHFVLSLLAAVGIFALHQRMKRRSWILGTTTVMFLAVFLPLSNVQIVLQDFHYYATKHDYPYFIPARDVAAMQWIKAHTNESDILLSSFYQGNFIPAYTGRRVFLGHGPQTIFLNDKFFIVNAFFNADTTDQQRKEFLDYWHITYLYYGDNERERGKYSPDASPLFRKVFVSGSTALYQVIR